MKKMHRQKGSVMLIAIFVIALMTTLVVGIAQMNTEQIQIIQNQIYATDALCIAEAGLNDAFSEIRDDNEWNSSLNKSYSGGGYKVKVDGSPPYVTITSTGTNAKGFIAEVQADITVGGAGPYVIRIDEYKINDSD
jgi:Tfp pilus assembly protein PilX